MQNKDKNLLAEIYDNRKLIWKLSKNDLKTKFAGSYLGRIWAFVQPIVTVLVYWFVFESGMKATAETLEGLEMPFVLWLVAGIVPWFYFSDCLSAGTSVLMEYNYLVKKVVFNIRILPVVKVISASFIHLFFVIFAVVLFLCYGYFPDLYTLQVIYYSICVTVLVLGICYITSSVVVFFRDMSQIVNIFLQIGIWLTPIMWNMDTMNIPGPLLTLLKFNPLYYIVSGYRDAFINKIWFFDKPGMTLYYWVFTIVIFMIGNLIFKRLRIHFADVL